MGGGAAIQIPALMFFGLPADQAIATNRFSAISNIFTILKFHKQGHVKWGIGIFLAIFAGIGAAVGSYMVTQIETDILEKGIGVILLLSVPMVFIGKDLGIRERGVKMTKVKNIIGGMIMMFLGVLGGFFSSMGVWFSYVYLVYYGMTYLQTAATRKIAGLAMISTSLVVFIPAGLIDWRLAISMLLGGAIGGWISAHYAQKLGNKWLRYIFAGVVLGSALKVLFF